MPNTHQAETAAIDYLIERGGSIFVNEVPSKTVLGLGRTIAGHEIYQILCKKGIARINTKRDQGDAMFGDTIEMIQDSAQILCRTGR